MLKYLNIVTILFFYSCTENFDLDSEQSSERVVVEGIITNNEGPYYVRLTKSRFETLEDINNTNVKYDPIKNALVVISDDFGNTDTLVPAISVKKYGEFRVYENGFYKTNSIKGVPGRSYHLYIKAEGNEYYASDYMQEVPDIDSLQYVKKILEKDGAKYIVPRLFFKDNPNKKNYYLIQFGKLEIPEYPACRLWQFSILDDAFVDSYVNGLVVENGQSPDGFTLYFYNYGDSIQISLSSLSYNAYQYYKSLISQFKNNGGAYNQTPTSPPSNISNNGLGFFLASATNLKNEKIIEH
jgi:hypothetical protein